MIIKIKLNDLSYRYDIFQIAALFYSFNKVEFTEEDFDISIYISSEKVTVKSEESYKEYYFDGSGTVKEQVKKYIFMFLSEETGMFFPWGTLVGIRPSKIALSLIRRGLDEENIVKYYKEHYMASREKAELCIEVAKHEEKIVNREKNVVSIYIGMPFCPTRCSYCSFASNPISGSKKLVEPYLSALHKEINEIARFVDNKNLKIESVYFGGGTPTAVSDSEFHELMKSIHANFVYERNLQEFTVESGRPDSITLDKLKTMKEFEVDRISINPQTMNDSTLKRIGRHHTVKDVTDKFKMARSLGFDNINMDIIIGLPGEGIDEVERTCEEIYKLRPDNLTVHGMSIKRASKLHEKAAIGEDSSAVEQQELNRMYDSTRLLAASLNMKPYYMYRQKNMIGNMENVGYASDNKEGIYNIQMIEEKQTIIAVGADAVSKIVFLDEDRIERFANVKDVAEYISRIDEMIKKKIELLEDLY